MTFKRNPGLRCSCRRGPCWPCCSCGSSSGSAQLPVPCGSAAPSHPALRLCMAAALRPRSAANPSVQKNPCGSRFSSLKEEGGERFPGRGCQLTEGGFRPFVHFVTFTKQTNKRVSEEAFLRAARQKCLRTNRERAAL